MRRAVGLVFSLLVACSSSANEPASPSDSAVTEAAVDSAIDTRPEVESGPVVDISGTTEITGSIVALKVSDFAGPQSPIGDMAVRIENAAGGFIDGTTDAEGKISFKVHAGKGPFDVTFAKKSFQAVSLLDVTASFGEVQVFPIETPGR